MRTNHHESEQASTPTGIRTVRTGVYHIRLPAGVGGTFVSGTANADCVHCRSPSVVDCDSISMVR